jgi:molecular chaperone DnaK
VVQYTPSHFQVLATDGDVHLGGVDWNDRLVDYVAEQFKARYGQDPHDSPLTIQMLRNDCDLAKIELSQKNETKVNCRHAGKSISVPITRELFESLTADLLQRTADTLELVLQQAKITAKELDAIVLVGGSTLMPTVPAMIRRLTGQEPYTGISPHTAVAQGAAIHAAILEARNRGDSAMTEKVRKMLVGVKQENVNSHGLGVAATNPRSGKLVNHVMIPRNSRLPAEARQTFKTVRDGQTRVSVQVLEGDAPDPLACSLLGKCRITDLPAGLAKGALIEVVYAFDTSGRITVRACDKTGGKQGTIEIERRGALTDQQVSAFCELANEYKVE